MKFINSAVSILKNKYFIAAAFFLIWMTFFDLKDWGLIFARKNKVKELQKSELILSSQIKETRKELDLLKTNAQTIEKYAREKFFMKKDNEDLFIVNTTTEK